jgi:type I restriction enzyme R subunit
MSKEYSEDALQEATAKFFEDKLGWDSVYAYKSEVLGEQGTLGRTSYRQVVLRPKLDAALRKLNPGLPDEAYTDAVDQLTATSATKTLLQTNRELTGLIRKRVLVTFKGGDGKTHTQRLRVIDFDDPENNEFLVVRELKISGYAHNRRPDIIGFVNGLPLLFIELKAHDKDVRVAYKDNLTDYKDAIPHIFHHNALVMLSNGHAARAGTFTSPYDFFHEWKRLDEEDEGVVDWLTMLKGMCRKDRFLDIVENFIHFDDSPSGGTIKALAANHQYLGVNRAFEAVQEREVRDGKLGVFWHTQGSGKSYSMLWLAQKVHRKVPGSFTFLILTDRVELDDQIVKTFVGCGAVDEAKAGMVHASSREDLKKLLGEDHRYIFSLVHKFNPDDTEPYSLRDNIIVIADEAHRTQNGKLAEAMRLVLPNASFIAFTGTPLIESAEDQLTRRTFGDYVSRYDFKRAVDDGATVKLFYDNRGEKLKLATHNINDRIADKIAEHDLDQDQQLRLERALGRDYHILTSDERLERIARDLCAHYTKRWETGNAMLVCIDKVTCVRMYDLIAEYWQLEIDRQERVWQEAVQELEDPQLLASAGPHEDDQVRWKAFARERADKARKKLDWLRETETCVVVSDEQNEVQKFKAWDLDIVPHRKKMKDRKLDEEFKSREHPFRLSIVCAMWLTGFDVPHLSTLYIDKPMKGHNLMQAIARANRKAPDKSSGLIVDYNGMLKGLRAALAKYGESDSGSGAGGEQPPAGGPDEQEAEFAAAIAACEQHLNDCGFDLAKLANADDYFVKQGLLDKANEDSAVNAVCKTDESRARFGVLARDVFKKRKALTGNAERVRPYRRKANAIDAIAKRLKQNKDHADITQVLMDLHAVVSETVEHAGPTRLPGTETGKVYDISHIDFDKLKAEFEKSANKNTTVQTLKDAVDRKLKQMIQRNPMRQDFYKRYLEIIDAYNRETDRVTIEETFEQLVDFVDDLSDEEQRAVREGLDEENLPIFDVLVEQKGDLDTRTRNRVKKVARELLASVKAELAKLEDWRSKRQTRAMVETFIKDYLWDTEKGLPEEAYSVEEVESLADVVYLHFYEQYEAADQSVYAMAANGAGDGTVGSGAEPSARPAPSLVSLPTGSSASPGSKLPLRVVAEDDLQPFVNAVPLLPLEVAAGGFSSEQIVASPDEFEWVGLDGKSRPAPGLFVAQVVGESMNRRIPNGSWCLWRANPSGTRQGKVVLAQHRDIDDPELGGRYTVKVYESEKVPTDDGEWRHSVVRLKPDSDDSSFESIVLKDLEEGELTIVAELVEVLA